MLNARSKQFCQEKKKVYRNTSVIHMHAKLSQLLTSTKPRLSIKASNAKNKKIKHEGHSPLFWMNL